MRNIFFGDIAGDEFLFVLAETDSHDQPIIVHDLVFSFAVRDAVTGGEDIIGADQGSGADDVALFTTSQVE